ncbi:MAG: hypothetical protein ACODAE_06500 [Gemmatimonadota bacterium]
MTRHNPDPFYAWLDHDAIRDLVHRARELEPGERLVLIKGLVPDLVDRIGLESFEAFLDEIRTKARRFEEARTHPGEGHESRRTPGEALGGPTPDGHTHPGGHRDPRRAGGRAAEREDEADAWPAAPPERGGSAGAG